MNMGRFAAFVRVEKRSIRPPAQNGRHIPSQRNVVVLLHGDVDVLVF
jgi:hypothetical protein